MLTYSLAGAQTLTTDLEYSARVKIPSAGVARIYFPIPQDSAWQEVLSLNIASPYPGDILKESTYDNRYWFAKHMFREGGSWEVKLKARVRRYDSPRRRETSANLDRYLKANQLVPVDAPWLRPVLQDIPVLDDPYRQARQIYEFVLSNMEYKKVGTGWGNGDTYWACSKKYGNCTDFHSLFISLARARKIPARFEIGFPIPRDIKEGLVKGYHCWLQFYVQGKGWIPVDASEAWKHPEKRDFYFGHLDSDRVLFSRGRDLALKENTRALNYFIYPHATLNEKEIRLAKRSFRYRKQ